MVKKAGRQPGVQMPYAARVAVLKFPTEPDIPDEKVIVYFFRATRH